MWASSYLPFLEERFSVLFEKICEEVLKVMFMGVSMLFYINLIKFHVINIHCDTPIKILSRCNKIIALRDLQ